jgi:UTP--glucose-1-phosphate uridylyltransferase
MVARGVIPAAGLGTRLHPVTTVVPKELLPIGIKPMIHYVVEEAVASGITRLAIVISPNKQAVRRYFSQPKVRECWERTGGALQLEFICQDEPRGLGDAVSLAREFTAGEPFALLLPDNIFVAQPPAIDQLQQVFTRYQASVLSLTRVNPGQTHRFQNTSPVEVECIGDNVYGIERIYPKGEHKPDLPFRVTGRAILTPVFFECIDRLRGKVEGELDDIQPLRELVLHQPLYGVEIKGRRYDAGNPLGYRRAFIDLSQGEYSELFP